MRRRGRRSMEAPGRRRRIEAETAPPPPRTAVSGHAPRSGRPPRSGRALELGAARVPGLEPRARGAAVVPFRKQPLQPHVEDDEQVARTLLLQAEAAGPTFAVAP